MSTGLPTAEIEYPSEDGEPMAETPIHAEAMMLLHQALQDFYADRSDVFIATDAFWYWEEGNPEARVAPDVMVVPGVGQRDRRSFFSWEDNGAVPAVVFEFASRGTYQTDEEDKFFLYEELGVREYFLFDPEGAYLSTPLKGYRLGEVYGRLRPTDGMIESLLGFKLRAEGRMLRLYDARNNVPIPTRLERADAERQRADAERQRADQLQAEVERLKAILAQRGENPS
ncbi:Uma2 family endonuclease [Limnoglobus roseus]|uniref:Uma2 family endonuclease n=1 Tax=Limnoglobus roseus TaxID=2598579 RepID=A0A5C1AP14_9BACT|nr:Uma2 family endonuclease [Limnoglobus roseus]QEL20325.1 Uma2 family endonuclease [Limnoglobus roseus]